MGIRGGMTTLFTIALSSDIFVVYAKIASPSSFPSPLLPPPIASLRLRIKAFYLNFVDKKVEIVMANVHLGAKGDLSLGPSRRKRDREEGYTLAQSSGDDHQAEKPLSVEEVWRYCCSRSQDFPLMFAVYRHFRARRCIFPTELMSMAPLL